MKLQVKNKIELYEIEIRPITQLAGENINKKSYILNSLVKHFSSTKYMDFESDMVDNVLLEMQPVGRKYFNIVHIRKREDILDFLKITKTSMLFKYVHSLLNNFDMQVEMDVIERALANIYEQLNLEIGKNINSLLLSYDSEKIFDIIQQSSVKDLAGRELDALDNLSLLQNLFGLVSELQEQNPQKQIIVIENIDHMLEYSGYVQLYKKAQEITDRYDVWFVFSTSLEGFVVIDDENICGINIINDMVYGMPDVEKISAFIMQQYPYYIQKEDTKIQEWLRQIIQKIGKHKVVNDMRSNVILKMINRSMCLNYEEKCTLNSMESSFLLDQTLI